MLLPAEVMMRQMMCPGGRVSGGVVVSASMAVRARREAAARGIVGGWVGWLAGRVVLGLELVSGLMVKLEVGSWRCQD